MAPSHEQFTTVIMGPMFDHSGRIQADLEARVWRAAALFMSNDDDPELFMNLNLMQVNCYRSRC